MQNLTIKIGENEPKKRFKNVLSVSPKVFEDFFKSKLYLREITPIVV